MYKTVFISYLKDGYKIQKGNTEILDNIINEWYENGYELVTLTSCPYPLEANDSSFILVFKSKD